MLQYIPVVLIQFTLGVMALFIILLVLVQRGRGGGLAGALGGPGGSSAFGAKAGDTFTKITIVVVSVWIVTCLLASIWAAHRGDAFGASDASLATGTAATGTAATEGMNATADEDAAATTDAAGEQAGETTADGPFLGEASADSEPAGESPAE